VTDALDSTLTLRLREVLASGDTTEADLRELLRRSSPSGRFYERARDIELVIWRRPPW